MLTFYIVKSICVNPNWNLNCLRASTAAFYMVCFPSGIFCLNYKKKRKLKHTHTSSMLLQSLVSPDNNGLFVLKPALLIQMSKRPNLLLMSLNMAIISDSWVRSHLKSKLKYLIYYDYWYIYIYIHLTLEGVSKIGQVKHNIFNKAL